MKEYENKVIFKTESYKIIGCCYELYNQIGAGHREKTYQKGLEKLFTENGVGYQAQYYLSIKVNDEIIDKHFFDFLLDDKTVLEIKTGNHFHRRDIDQLYSYLKSSKLKLGILVNFSSNGVHFKRVLNSK